MGSAGATPNVPTRLLLTHIPDSWSWMRPDLLVRLLPFTAAYAVIYVASNRSAWLGLEPGNLTAQLVFAAVAAPLMFGAAHARVLPEIMPSVTEYTTRAFEPIYNERPSKIKNCP